jgi:hypothetical protein
MVLVNTQCHKFIYFLEGFFLAITSSKFHQIAKAIFKNIGIVLTKNNQFKNQSNLKHGAKNNTEFNISYSGANIR